MKTAEKSKSVGEINERIGDGSVVTTGTFGPMCSSGVFLNFGHADPPIKCSGGRLLGCDAAL